MPRSDYWIKIFDSFPGHAKVRALARMMNWNLFEARGFLVSFWLLVASDAPDGVLTGLASPEAVLKALAIERADIRQAIIRALKTLRLVDVDADGVCRVHDWESGGGQLEKTRRGNNDRQRDCRERTRKGGQTDGAAGDADCHDDVTRESKSKGRETPPNPPQAGGGFADFQEKVFQLWREECGRVPVEVVKDNHTTRGVAMFAKLLGSDEIDLDTVRAAMRGFLAAKYGPDLAVAARMKSWSLKTCAESPSTYLPKRDPPRTPAAEAVRPELTVHWKLRCDTCGHKTGVYTSSSDDNPGPMPCTNVFAQPRCKGTMLVCDDNVN